MSQSMSVRKDNLKEKLRYYMNIPSRLIASVNTALLTAMVALSPTLCAGGNNTTNVNYMNTLFTAMANVIFQIAFWIGAIIIVSGIFSWLLAQKDENADAQSRAIKFIVVGLALTSLKFIVTPLIQGLGLNVG